MTLDILAAETDDGEVTGDNFTVLYPAHPRGGRVRGGAGHLAAIVRIIHTPLALILTTHHLIVSSTGCHRVSALFCKYMVEIFFHGINIF